MEAPVSYVIERGTPVPTKGRPKTPIRIALDDMEIGDSVLFPTSGEFMKANSMLVLLRPKKFRTRKIPGEGWRVWRVE